MEHEGSLASPLGTWVALSNDGIIGTFIKDLLLPLAKLATMEIGRASCRERV